MVVQTCHRGAGRSGDLHPDVVSRAVVSRAVHHADRAVVHPDHHDGFVDVTGGAGIVGATVGSGREDLLDLPAGDPAEQVEVVDEQVPEDAAEVAMKASGGGAGTTLTRCSRRTSRSSPTRARRRSST